MQGFIVCGTDHKDCPEWQVIADLQWHSAFPFFLFLDSFISPFLGFCTVQTPYQYRMITKAP